MITINQINTEQAEIKYRLQNEEMKKAVENKLRKRSEFLKLCKIYIETNPNPDFLSAELERIKQKISLRMSGFNTELYEKCATKEFNKAKKEFEKSMKYRSLKPN